MILKYFSKDVSKHKYHHLLSTFFCDDDLNNLIENDFSNFTKDKLDVLLDSTVVKSTGSEYRVSVPVLTPNLTNEVADYISGSIKNTSKKIVSDFGKENVAIKGGLLFCVVIVGYLWQKMLHKKYLCTDGGKVVLIKDEERCRVFYTDTISCGTDKIIAWINCNLQKNNSHLGELFYHQDVSDMFSLTYDDGLLIPVRESADRLRKLGLIKLENKDQSYISSYYLATPHFTIDSIKENKQLIKRFAKYGEGIVKDIYELSISTYKDLNYVKEYTTNDWLQAFYFIFSYELINSLIEMNIISKFDKVANT
jgi:hypothetical protein